MPICSMCAAARLGLPLFESQHVRSEAGLDSFARFGEQVVYDASSLDSEQRADSIMSRVRRASR